MYVLERLDSVKNLFLILDTKDNTREFIGKTC